MSRPPPPPDSLVFAINVLEQSKHDYGIPILLEAHQLLILLYTNAGNVEDALKIALKTRFLVEQQQKPKMQLKDRLSTLFNIIMLLQSPNQPEEIFALGRLVVDDLRRMYLCDIRKCFGEDSTVFRHEQASLDSYYKKFKESITFDKDWVEEDGWHMTVVRPGENKRRFVENMNKVLAWAGLQPLTDEQC